MNKILAVNIKADTSGLREALKRAGMAMRQMTAFKLSAIPKVVIIRNRPQRLRLRSNPKPSARWPSNLRCASCGRDIPPGKAGRKCKPCRGL